MKINENAEVFTCETCGENHDTRQAVNFSCDMCGKRICRSCYTTVGGFLDDFFKERKISRICGMCHVMVVVKHEEMRQYFERVVSFKGKWDKVFPLDQNERKLRDTVLDAINGDCSFKEIKSFLDEHYKSIEKLADALFWNKPDCCDEVVLLKNVYLTKPEKCRNKVESIGLKEIKK